MRFTMICIGSTGDVRPYVILGRELQARGHDVGICAFTDFRELIQAEGMRFFPLYGDAKDFMSKIMKPGATGLGYLQQVYSSLRAMIWPLLKDLESACDEAEVIVATYLGEIIRSIAEVKGVPFIQTHYYPMDSNDSTPIPAGLSTRGGKVWNLATYRLAYLLISTLERLYLKEWRKEHGMRPRKMQAKPDYNLNGHTIPVLYAVSPLLMSRPPSWGENIHMTGFWLDEEASNYNPDESLQAFLDAGDKPVYIGFGSMTSGDMGQTLDIVLAAIRDSGVRAILSTGWGDVEIPKQENVYVVGYVPHDWLFDQVCAVVHHGGAGTLSSGLLAGKPTLVIPFGGDQPFWAMRVRMLGLGPKPIRREKLTAAKLSRALSNLTTVQSYRVAAQEISQRLRMENGTQIAANVIEHELEKWLCEEDVFHF